MKERGAQVPTQICGAGFAFLGFAVSLIIGLWTGNCFVTVVLRALAVMAVFYLVGLLLALVGQKAVQEHFEGELARLEQAKPDDGGPTVQDTPGSGEQVQAGSA